MLPAGRRRWLVLGAALALAAAAGTFGYQRFWRAAPVAAVAAAQGSVAVRVTGPGTVQARVPVTLGSRITATVARLEADVGDFVRSGQLLAVLDDRDLAARRSSAAAQQSVLARNLEAARAAVAKAQADLELAQSRHRRDSELLRAGFLSQGSLDASDAALQSARASLDSARAQLAARQAEGESVAQELRYADVVLSHTRIRAPGDGVVIARLVEAGATVVPGSALFRLADPAALWVATRVDESVVGRVAPGQPARIRLRTGEALTGRVARIARQSDAATRELEVSVAFDTPPARFAIDQEAEVAIDAGEDAGLVVPLSALARDRDGRLGVLVVAGGRARFRAVETGADDGRQVLIRAGLAAGEIVVAPAAGARHGARVRPLVAPPR